MHRLLPHPPKLHLRPRHDPDTQDSALLIEDVVEGQQALVLLQEYVAAVEQDGGIHGGLAGIRGSGKRHTNDQRSGKNSSGFGEFVDRLRKAALPGRQGAGAEQTPREAPLVPPRPPA